MCFAVIEVRYRNKIEPDQLLSMADVDACNKRIEDLKKLETVERIIVFNPTITYERVSSWDVKPHDRDANKE